MSCPGLIGLPRSSSVLTPESLTTRLTTLLGATLVGLWIPEDDIVDGSLNILSATGRVGGDAASVGASYLTRVSLNGRYFRANTQVATTVALRTGSLTLRCAFSVQRVRELPFGSHRTAAATSTTTPDIQVLIGSSGTSDYYASGVHHKQNGSINEAVPAGIHTVQSILDNDTTSTFDIGGRPVSGANRNFIGDIGTVAFLSAIPSNPVAAAVTALLNGYYSI